MIAGLYIVLRRLKLFWSCHLASVPETCNVAIRFPLQLRLQRLMLRRRQTGSAEEIFRRNLMTNLVVC